MADERPESIYFGEPPGDFEFSSTGLRVDPTVRTKCILALRATRGAYWADTEYGSRLRSRQTLVEAEAHADHDVREALQPLIDSREISATKVTRIFQDADSGGIGFEVAVLVSEREAMAISLLPMGVA